MPHKATPSRRPPSTSALDRAAAACIGDLLDRLQEERRQHAAALAEAEAYRLQMLAALDVIAALDLLFRDQFRSNMKDDRFRDLILQFRAMRTSHQTVAA